MRTKQIVILSLLGLTAAALAFGYVWTQQKAATATPPTTGAPQGNPGRVAPEGAYSSCERKQEGDACYFIIRDAKQAGVCQSVYGELTCGPTFPDGSY